MEESIIVRQDSSFGVDILARDVHQERSLEHLPVEDIHFLTPYGMLLASLGSCTAVVLLTYSQYHGIGLEKVELRLTYDRVYGEDCKTCTEDNDYEEHIAEEITLFGELSEGERRRLLGVSKQCPIHKMLSHGIEVVSTLAGAGAADSEAKD